MLRKFLGKEETTDVLAFPVKKDLPKGYFHIGEVVVNKEQAVKQASEYGVSLEEELARLFAHGALHLLGYSDKTSKQKGKMSDIEDKIVKKLED